MHNKASRALCQKHHGSRRVSKKGNRFICMIIWKGPNLYKPNFLCEWFVMVLQHKIQKFYPNLKSMQIWHDED